MQIHFHSLNLNTVPQSCTLLAFTMRTYTVTDDFPRSPGRTIPLRYSSPSTVTCSLKLHSNRLLQVWPKAHWTRTLLLCNLRDSSSTDIMRYLLEQSPFIHLFVICVSRLIHKWAWILTAFKEETHDERS